MTGLSTVTLIFTANLHGDLHLLPRLFTLIQMQKQTADGLVFLMDVGDTCALDAWACQATHGRAPFLVLDSMGYDAAIIGGPETVPIPPSSLRQLVDSMIMPIIIWDRAKTLTKKDVSVTVVPGSTRAPDSAPAIRIDRSAERLPKVGDTAPTIGDVAHGSIARVDMAWPEWCVIAASVIPLTDQPADPTISAVVELVEAEARLYVHGQGSAR